MAGVLLILFLLFLVTPIVELYLIIKVADATGLLNTVALLILVSVVGAWLVRREGLGILRRAQRELNEGRIPSREMVEGLLVLFAGALMLTPGFATDALGLSLLFPPTRALIRLVVSRRLASRVSSGRQVAWQFGYRGGEHIVEARSTDQGSGPDGLRPPDGRATE